MEDPSTDDKSHEVCILCRLDVTMGEPAPAAVDADDDLKALLSLVVVSVGCSLALFLLCWTDFWTTSWDALREEAERDPTGRTTDAGMWLAAALSCLAAGLSWLLRGAVALFCPRRWWSEVRCGDPLAIAVLVFSATDVGIALSRGLWVLREQALMPLPVGQREGLWLALVVPLCGWILWSRLMRALRRVREQGWSGTRRWMWASSTRAFAAIGIVACGVGVVWAGFGLPDAVQNPVVVVALVAALLVKCWLGWFGFWFDVAVGVACLLRWLCVGDVTWPGYGALCDDIADVLRAAGRDHGAWDTILFVLSCVLSVHTVARAPTIVEEVSALSQTGTQI